MTTDMVRKQIYIHRRQQNLLRQLARQRGMSLSRMIDEMATLLLAEFDAQTRFMLCAHRGRGKTEPGLKLLQKAEG